MAAPIKDEISGMTSTADDEEDEQVHNAFDDPASSVFSVSANIRPRKAEQLSSPNQNSNSSPIGSKWLIRLTRVRHVRIDVQTYIYYFMYIFRLDLTDILTGIGTEFRRVIYALKFRKSYRFITKRWDNVGSKGRR